jgi:lipopolysaccharide export LptBFGC system permease protein LptF
VTAVVSTVLFVGQTIQFLRRMPEVGLGFVVSVLPLFLPVTLALTLPFAFLVAAVLVYGRLADDNEVIAMRMAGIHPWAVVAPGVFAGAVLSFFCLDLQQNLAPAAVNAQDEVRGDIRRLFLEVVERAERNSFTMRGLKMSWERVEGGELVGLHISRSGDAPGSFQEIHAARGLLRKDPAGGTLVFDLRDCLVVDVREDGVLPSRGALLVFTVPADQFLGRQGGTAKARALDYEGLLFRIFRLPPGAGVRRDMERALFGRISIALTPLVFALCGIPLALLVGKGSRAAAAILAFGVALAFFVLWQLGSSLSASGTLPAGPALLAGNGVLALGGAFLLRAVVRR